MISRILLSGVAAVFVASVPASAATVVYGAANPGGNVTLTPAGPGSVSSSITFDVSGTGAFLATFNFDNPFSVAIAQASASFNYDPDVITFTSGSFGGLGTFVPVAGPTGSSIQVDLASLAGGARSLTLAGTINNPGAGNNFARIGGSITLTQSRTAVPEPATWALFILGFGTVGGLLRRRNRSVGVSKARLTFA